jgi:hypothetical protein
MDLSKTQLIESVFTRGGEMGARMRAGGPRRSPLEQWPQSLRACARIMLGSGYPMLISRGADSRCCTTMPFGRFGDNPNTRRRSGVVGARWFPKRGISLGLGSTGS